mmetsp:Transcript_1083/g.2313  ORF Transcript_1083/g.2313 Transcript_1083/m.2313 type:complete len:88 (+) Transcript_1083:1089-1352(+)
MEASMLRIMALESFLLDAILPRGSGLVQFPVDSGFEAFDALHLHPNLPKRNSQVSQKYKAVLFPRSIVLAYGIPSSNGIPGSIALFP